MLRAEMILVEQRPFETRVADIAEQNHGAI
jgi:hypothetical protein